jgi:hypothetical protein
MSSLHAARYIGIDAQGREVSEHIAFNEAIGRSGGRLHVFPELQVHAPAQHLYDASEFDFRWRATMQLHEAVEYFRPAWRSLLART